ncbi:hypothetical protein EKO27_g5926 [Xylaria grammica]|uniref:PD-(D/E)XK nuclease-like domain-containing protein n=1 Tax=Xylaria grammica TaxID=363999 RepID=A0A439D469_9PEZI|nr:hypothetical protein EKO27_g5926 [Xylaria grammica]
MHASVVLAWLTDVCASLPSPSSPSSPSPESTGSIGPPPSPPPSPSRARYPRRRQPPPPPTRQNQNRQPRKKTNHLPAAVETFDPIPHQGQAARMPPRRRSPRKKVVAAEGGRADEPLRLDGVSAALDTLDDPPNTHPSPPNDGQGRNRLHGLPDRSHDDDNGDDVVPSKIARPLAAAAASTNTTSRSQSIFSNKLSQSVFFEPPTTTDAPTSWRSAVTASTRARSHSPIKQASDLMKLDIPVYWRDISNEELQRRMEHRGSAGLLKSINSVLRKGYLPLELRDILDPKFGLDDGDDRLYAKTPSAPVSESQLRQAKFVAGTMSRLSSASPQQAGGGPDLDTSLLSLIHLQSLLSELEVLGTIVATTEEYSRVPRAEASWNERIHGRMLDLAASHTPSVGVENVTRANIAKDFLPPTSARHTPLPAGSKLIDYAMVLKPSPAFADEESRENKDNTGRKKLSIERIVHFVDMLDYPSFNQSSYSPLCSMPSGVFIETKVNTQKSTEAKSQLGMWLASWYGRVSEFPESRGHDDDGGLRPPVLPILLVEAGVWGLYFAFDAGSHYDVCGRVSIGSTHSLEDAYRLLAVLRVLAKWMETDFLAWVEACFQRTGV